jgi:hypothetical protein
LAIDMEGEMRCDRAIRLGCAILSLSAAAVVGVVPLDVTSAVSAPVNSGTVSFVNVDKAPIQLTVTDNVSNDNYTFQLKVGEETRGLKVSGDKNNGFNSNFKWKATGQDAQKKSISRCGNEKRPVTHGSYGRIDVYAVTKVGKEMGSAC